MNLDTIKWLSETFGDRYVAANDLFRKSLNEVATPAMGHKEAVLWIITDNVRGEDIVRRHYEAMLREDSILMGQEQPIDPYGGPRALAIRLAQQGFRMELTVLPPGFDKGTDYLKLKAQEFQLKEYDVQAVCYNLENRVMPTATMLEAMA